MHYEVIQISVICLATKKEPKPPSPSDIVEVPINKIIKNKLLLRGHVDCFSTVPYGNVLSG